MENPSELSIIDRELKYLRSNMPPFEYINPNSIMGMHTLMIWSSERRDHLIYLRASLLRCLSMSNRLEYMDRQREIIDTLKIGLQAIEEVLKILTDSNIKDEQIQENFIQLRVMFMNQLRFQLQFTFDHYVIDNYKE